MFEIHLLPLFIHFINGILSGMYTGSFLEETYRKKTTLAVWGAIYFFCQITVFEIRNSRDQINDMIGVTINICILLFLQLLLFDRDWSKQIFIAFSFTAGKEIVKYIASVFSFIFNELWAKIPTFLLEREAAHTLKEMHVLENILNAALSMIDALFYAVLLSLYLWLMSKKFVKKEYPLHMQENIFLILPCMAALCISITIKMMIVSVENGMTVIIYDTVPETKFWIPVICFLLLSAIVANVMLFQKLVQYNEEAGRCLMLENQIRQMQKEVTEIQDIYADMRGLRHDMRNHLSNILLYVKSVIGTDCEELNRYIGKMEETVGRLDVTYQTGNPITDIIIHQKSQEAQKKKILFEVDFNYPSERQIDVYDIGVVLHNALENAIEACSKAEGEPYISLHSYGKGNLFFIEIENKYTGEILFDKETGLPISHKKNKKLHGLGMANIQKCAKKYMGDIDIALSSTGDEKIFALTIMMYGKSSHPDKGSSLL